MIRLYVPDNEIDQALLLSLLEGEGIPYFVHNDHFGTLRTGPRIDLLNQKTVMVPEPFAERARELLGHYLANREPASAEPQRRYGLIDRLRMVVETLLFGWFVPGRQHTPVRAAEQDETEGCRGGSESD